MAEHVPDPLVEAGERLEMPHHGEEKAMLAGFLDGQRATVLRKVAGLTTQQATARAVPTSGLTAAGVVRHLAWNERVWLGNRFAGLQLPDPGAPGAPEEGAAWDDFVLSPGETLAAVVSFYDGECRRSRQIVAGASLDQRVADRAHDFSLRWVLLHLLAETARHAGHLDLLREAADGQPGE